jgi:RimJ/RimL family protein N-acetyltransferase
MPEVRLPYEFAAPLRTARLVLRTMTAGDVDDIHAYQSRADVCRYLEFEPRTHDEVAEPGDEVREGGRAAGRRAGRARSVQRRLDRAVPAAGHARGGVLRRDLWFKGCWGDTGIYAILDREWAARS